METKNNINLEDNTINGVHSYFLKYYNQTKTGEIIIGREVKKQLDLLIKDLDNPAYVYDMDNAHMRIDFIEMCVKLTKSPFYGKPMILMLWQKAIIEALYSFKWTDEGYFNYYGDKPSKQFLRRFKKMTLIISRKNTKSETTSALALTEFFLGEAGNDIVCSSNDDKQASIIFDAINTMRELIDPKDKRSKKTLQFIKNLKTNTKIFKLSDKTRSKEGRNIGFAILDETNEMVNNTIAKSIDQSQSTKDEPTVINITTEGFLDNGYLSDELKYARSVLAEEQEDATLLSFIYTQDSEKEVWEGMDNSKIWGKSNPALGVVKKVSYLKDQIRKAQVDMAERAFMMCKDFNLKQSTAQGWMNESDYENAETDSFDLKSLWGCHAIGSVDLSESVDLTSAKLTVFKPDNSKKYIISHYWIPESKLDGDKLIDGQDYRKWERDGLLTICPGTDVDTQLIHDWFLMMNNEYEILPHVIGLDSWGSKYLKKQLEDTGFKVEKINQGFYLSSAMKMVEQEFKAKNILYNNNKIDQWCLSNTAFELNNLGQVRPVKIKGQEKKRIDGAVSLIIGFATYQLHKTAFHNCYGR